MEGGVTADERARIEEECARLVIAYARCADTFAGFGRCGPDAVPLMATPKSRGLIAAGTSNGVTMGRAASAAAART